MPALTFNPDGHRYEADGRHVPGVTSVLSWLSGYDKVPGGYLEAAALRGTFVHQCTELHDQSDLDWSSIPGEWLGYVGAWVRFRDETGFEPELIEARVFSSRHWYAGTLDRAGVFHKIDAPPTVLDIKTTAQLHPVVALQTAAYHAAMPGKSRYKRRLTVQLRSDGTYRLEWHKANHDLARFLAALTLYQWSNAA